MHIPDFNSYRGIQYFNKPVLAIGWLDSGNDFEHNPNYIYPKGYIDDMISKLLLEFCLNGILLDVVMGHHECNLCIPSESISIRIAPSQWRALGCKVSFVFGKQQVFCAPDMIYHYVTEHQYHPPEAFLLALQESPLPNSPDYITCLQNIDYSSLEPYKR